MDSITPQPDLRDCVTTAGKNFSSSSQCRSKKAVVWYEECMLRYSDKATFSVLEDDDPIQIFNPNNTVPDAALLMKILNSTMTEIASAASKMSGKKFATKQKSYMPANPLYCLVQCTPDLSENDCNRCLQKAIVNLPNDTAGAKMLSESCYLRYELFPFYENIDTLSPSITSPSVPKVMKKKGQPFKAIIIISAVVAASVSLVLIIVIIRFSILRRKAEKRHLK